MYFSPNNDFGDRRIAQQKDDDINRRIAIENIRREQEENQAIWQEKQIELYPKSLVLSKTPTLQEVLIEENGKLSRDENLNYDRALANLLTLANKETALYILDNLTPPQIFTMNQQWSAVVQRVKKNYAKVGLDKDVFLALIRSLDDSTTAALGEGGEDDNGETKTEALNPQGRRRQLNQNEESQKIQDNIDAQRENERLADEALVKKIKTEKIQRAQQGLKAYGNKLLKDNEEERENMERAIKSDKRMNVLAELKGKALQNTLDDKSSKSTAKSLDDEDDNEYPAPASTNTPLSKQSVEDLRPLAAHLYRDKNIVFKKGFSNTEHSRSTSLKRDDLIKAIKYFRRENPPLATARDDFLKTIDDDLSQPLEELPEEKGVGLKRGKGLKITKRQRVIIGRGCSPTPTKPKTIANKKLINGKYIDITKLKDNILCVRYVSTGGYIPQLKSQLITKGTREVIDDILGNKYDERLYKKLSADERRVIKRFVDVLKLNVNVKDDDDVEFNKQFEILRGEYLAGNSNETLKAQLKKYVVEAIAQNIIPRHQGYSLLFQLSL